MSILSSKQRRFRRGAQNRKRQATLGVVRIVARLTGKHTYAQIIAPDSRVLAATSTVEREIREALNGRFADVAAAQRVGQRLAEKAASLELKKVAFDRGGRKYHGRIRALAEASRAAGMKF